MRDCVCVRVFGQILAKLVDKHVQSLEVFWKNIAGYNVFKGNKDSVTVLWDHP